MSETSIVCTPFSFASKDKTSTISACLWTQGPLNEDPSDETPLLAHRGIVQIAHGMCEHKERYDNFARELVRSGFVVCASDHIGHGASCTQDLWGHFPQTGGVDILVEDLHTLRTLIQKKTATKVPYYLFGHSMGSYIVRCYLARHGLGLSGAILCGTGIESLPVARAGNAFARTLCKLRGEHHVSKVLYELADGAYVRSVKNPRTQFDWLSHNEKNVDEYISDPACGFPFTAGGYATLTALVIDACSPDVALRVPSNLPLLFVAGEDDPVGDCGKGVLEAAELYKKAGCSDVSAIIYPYMRHEILHENDHERVYQDIASWMMLHPLKDDAHGTL